MQQASWESAKSQMANLCKMLIDGELDNLSSDEFERLFPKEAFDYEVLVELINDFEETPLGATLQDGLLLQIYAGKRVLECDVDPKTALEWYHTIPVDDMIGIDNWVNLLLAKKTGLLKNNSQKWDALKPIFLEWSKEILANNCDFSFLDQFPQEASEYQFFLLFYDLARLRKWYSKKRFHAQMYLMLRLLQSQLSHEDACNLYYELIRLKSRGKIDDQLAKKGVINEPE